MKRAALLCLLLAGSVRAEVVVCDVDYGGTTRRVVAAPTADPLQVRPVEFESWFLFRVVFRAAPADLAGIKLYTYGRGPDGPQLIHQASHPYPPPAAADGSFTGVQAVYEPRLNAELQYRCALADDGK